MKTKKLVLWVFITTLSAFSLTNCQNQKSNSSDEVNTYATLYEAGSELLKSEAKTFCVHEVVRVTPHDGDCNVYKVGDKVCINCPDGECPRTTRFYSSEGGWLEACIVETRVVDSECKDIWPRGTCNYYVTLSKRKS